LRNGVLVSLFVLLVRDNLPVWRWMGRGSQGFAAVFSSPGTGFA
jgi:hypothetical protein